MTTLPPEPGGPDDDAVFHSLVSGLDLNWDTEHPDTSPGAEGSSTPRLDDPSDERPEDHYDDVPHFGPPRRGAFADVGDGTYDVNLPSGIVDELIVIIEDLRGVLLAGESELLRRLYPAAYPEDEELEASYQELVGDQLLAHRLENLDRVEESLHRSNITSDELHGWMQALNDYRLMLGTLLNITDDRDEDEPDDLNDPSVAPTVRRYRFLTDVQHEIILTLFGEFPAEGQGPVEGEGEGSAEH